jgi:hypothetical protein
VNIAFKVVLEITVGAGARKRHTASMLQVFDFLAPDSRPRGSSYRVALRPSPKQMIIVSTHCSPLARIAQLL